MAMPFLSSLEYSIHFDDKHPRGVSCESNPILFKEVRVKAPKITYYLQSTTEENLCLCVIHGVWGSKTNKIADWHLGDKMIVYVDRRLAALFSMVSDPFTDKTPIWPGDIYPYRVAIELEHIIDPDERYSISSTDTRDVLFKFHNRSYAVGLVLSARPLMEEPAQVLLRHLEESQVWKDYDPHRILAMQREQNNNEQEKLAEEVVQARVEVAETDDSISPHTQMQYYIAQLGRALHYQIWIPKADQGRVFDRKRLAEFSETELPPLPFSDDVVRIVRNIDAIWLNEDNPTHLFEVEHTTSIYSGLLRMSDLVTLIPSLNIFMYICAGNERREKVKVEVNRPTFARRTMPLARRCRFLPFEKLAEFMGTQQRYLGHFNTSILDELSETLVD
jgi:hypothetical protein